jgi:hypothetical protein
MGNAAKGITGVAVEQGVSGLQLLLNPTAITALPASLTNAIPGAATTGMRLVIAVFNHTAAGTISLAGTAPLTGAAVNETTVSLPTAEQTGDTIFYVTTSTFASVNASGVTIGTGLTGGTVVIFGIQVAKRLIAGETKLVDKTAEHSPLDQRGVFDRDFHLLPLKNEPEWEFAAEYYPTDGLWLSLGAYSSAPTSATIPAAPPALLTGTSVATTGSASLTTQPSLPGMTLGIALGGTAPATAGTVTITGTDEYGEPMVEVVVPATKTQTTYYSQNRFASVATNGVAFTAFGAGATITITGYFGWQLSGLPSDTLSSFALEQYDSTSSHSAAFCLVSEWTHEGGLDKEYKVSGKGPLQFTAPVGDPTLAANQITAFAQVTDRPVTGYRSLVYVDAIGGTPGTTQQPDCMDFKIAVKINWAFKYTSWAPFPSRTANRAYRNRREVDVELTCDMTNTTFQNEYLAWKRRATRLVAIQVRGQLLGVDGGNTYYQGCQWILPLKWIEEPGRSFSGNEDSVTVKLKGKGYFLPSLGYSHKFTQWVTAPAW